MGRHMEERQITYYRMTDIRDRFWQWCEKNEIDLRKIKEKEKRLDIFSRFWLDQSTNDKEKIPKDPMMLGWMKKNNNEEKFYSPPEKVRGGKKQRGCRFDSNHAETKELLIKSMKEKDAALKTIEKLKQRIAELEGADEKASANARNLEEIGSMAIGNISIKRCRLEAPPEENLSDSDRVTRETYCSVGSKAVRFCSDYISVATLFSKKDREARMANNPRIYQKIGGEYFYGFLIFYLFLLENGIENRPYLYPETRGRIKNKEVKKMYPENAGVYFQSRC